MPGKKKFLYLGDDKFFFNDHLYTRNNDDKWEENECRYSEDYNYEILGYVPYEIYLKEVSSLRNDVERLTKELSEERILTRIRKNKV